MFTEIINPEAASLKDRSARTESSSADLQYEICGKFMKIASEKLYIRELELMQASQKLLQKIGESFSFQKDVSSTQDSLNLDTLIDEDENFLQTAKSRLLLRKSQSSTCVRRTDSGMSDAIRQVQKKCSQKTASIIANLISQYRRGKQRLTSLQKLEKEVAKKQLRYQISQQELILLKKKMADLEGSNTMLNIQCADLKLRQKQLKQQIKTVSNSKSRFVQGSIYKLQVLKAFLEEKQQFLSVKEKEIKRIQEGIESSVGKILQNDDICQKCCSLLKKIKDSILKYRKYLEEEAAQVESLYDQFRHKIQ